MENFIYSSGKTSLINGILNLLEDDIKIALVTDKYEPKYDPYNCLDTVFSDIKDEVQGIGYVAGGKKLVNKRIKTGKKGNVIFTADSVTWKESTFSTRAAILYQDTGNKDTSILIAYIDFMENQEIDNLDFTIEWNNKEVFELRD
jgi:hypothetical protein